MTTRRRFATGAGLVTLIAAPARAADEDMDKIVCT